MELFLEGLGIHEPEIGEDSEIARWNWEFAGRQFELNRSGCWLWDPRFGISRVSSPIGTGEMILWALLGRSSRRVDEAYGAPPAGPGEMIPRALLGRSSRRVDEPCRVEIPGTASGNEQPIAGPRDPLIPIATQIHSQQSPGETPTFLLKWICVEFKIEMYK